MMVISKMQANGVEIEEGFKMAGICSTNSWRCVERKEDGDMLRTVECLRGRLLAERVASRDAKEEFELMIKRVTELERLLAVEIKARNRAEKRLRCVLKKLEFLKKIPSISDDSGKAPTDASLASSLSSSSSGIQFPLKAKSSFKTGDSANSTGSEGGGKGSTYFSADSAHHSVDQEASWSSAESSSSVRNDVLLCQDEATESKQTLLEDELIKGGTTSKSDDTVPRYPANLKLTVIQEDAPITLQKSKEELANPMERRVAVSLAHTSTEFQVL